MFHLLSADLLTFGLLWYAAGSLIRSHASALDRLMLSGAVLIGWTCLLGLVAGYWPWGLHPVALAEVTALPLAAARLLRHPTPARRPAPWRARLRKLVPAADRPVLLSGALAAAFLLYPLLRRDAVGRLGTVIAAEDLGRHTALYDTILRLGGFTSLHQEEAFSTVTQGLETYPQGSHLALAVVTSFLRGDTERGEALAQISLFVILFTLVTAGLATAVLWAMHRAAGPALRGWRGLALALPSAAYLVVVELPRMHSRGFLSEIFALGLLAILVGLAIRPLNRVREQALALAALTVGVSFGHYLLLPVAAVTVLAWAAVHWRGWRRHWTTVLPAGLAAGALALVPAYLNQKNAGSADVLTLPGGIGPVGRNLLLPLLVAAFAALLTRSSLRNRPRRVALLSVTSISLISYGVMQYQLSQTGATSYFYEKMLHQLLVIGLICFAAALLPILGRRPLTGRSAGAGDRARPGLLRLRSGTALIAAAGCLVFAVVSNGQPADSDSGTVGWRDSAGRELLRGGTAHPTVAARIAAIDASRPKDGRVTVSLVGSRAWGETTEDWASAEDNLWLGVLNRDQGRSWEGWAWALRRRSAQELVAFAATSPEPLRFVVDDGSALLADLRTLTAGGRYPELAVSVLRYDGGFVMEPVQLG